MAGQITWRNVDAPNLAPAIEGVRTAAQLLGNAAQSGQDMATTYKGLQTDAANRAIALRAAQIQDPAAFRQAMIDRSLLGLDGENASLSTIQNLGAGVNTLSERDMVQNKAVDQLHNSANAFNNEQWDKQAKGVLDTFTNMDTVAGKAAYRKWVAEQNPPLELRQRVEVGLSNRGFAVANRSPVDLLLNNAASGGVGGVSVSPNGVAVTPGGVSTQAPVLDAASNAVPGSVSTSGSTTPVGTAFDKAVLPTSLDYTQQDLIAARDQNIVNVGQSLTKAQRTNTDPETAITKGFAAGAFGAEASRGNVLSMMQELQKTYREENNGNELSNDAAVALLMKHRQEDTLGTFHIDPTDKWDAVDGGFYYDLDAAKKDFKLINTSVETDQLNTISSQEKQNAFLNTAKQDTANKQAYLDNLLKQSPEDLAVLQDNGTLDRARANLALSQVTLKDAEEKVAASKANVSPQNKTAEEELKTSASGGTAKSTSRGEVKTGRTTVAPGSGRGGIPATNPQPLSKTQTIQQQLQSDLAADLAAVNASRKAFLNKGTTVPTNAAALLSAAGSETVPTSTVSPAEQAAEDLKTAVDPLKKDLEAKRRAEFTGYDAVIGSGEHSLPDKKPSEMTISEALDYQEKLKEVTKAKGLGVIKGVAYGTSAIGALQITKQTLEDIGQDVFGSGWKNVVLTPQNQDKLGEHLFRTRVNGNGDALGNVWQAFTKGKYNTNVKDPAAKKKAQEERDKIARLPWEQARKTIYLLEAGLGQKKRLPSS